MLERTSNTKVRVFAVWEPILPTDWIEPSRLTLNRFADSRVRQFWDKSHALAQVMADASDSQPKPKCCNRKGVLWDLIAVYPAGAVWNDRLPPAIVFDGPVVKVVPDKWALH
jgi:hypothetical protein